MQQIPLPGLACCGAQENPLTVSRHVVGRVGWKGEESLRSADLQRRSGNCVRNGLKSVLAIDEEDLALAPLHGRSAAGRYLDRFTCCDVSRDDLGAPGTIALVGDPSAVRRQTG